MTDSEKMLYIPNNVKTRSEIFPGYGLPELIRSFICAGTSAAFCITLIKPDGNPTAGVIAMVVIAGLSVAVQVRDDYNQSVCSQIGHMLRFLRQQQTYPYRYREEWPL